MREIDLKYLFAFPEFLAMPVHNLNSQDTLKSNSKDQNSEESLKLPYINRVLSNNSASDISSLSVTPVTSRGESVELDENEILESKQDPYSNSNIFNLFNNNLSQPQTTSILKPGSKFIGSQQSGRSTYEVSIEFKFVDLSKAYLNGFLKIKGLTESYPEIITFFDGEIISDYYPFLNSRKPLYPTATSVFSTDDETDIEHWTKFPYWKNKSSSNTLSPQSFKKMILSEDYIHTDYLSKKYIYMRWKEKFLIPDAKVSNIEGASFAGFYYICFNQFTGDIMGLYYHKESEKFQHLELNYVEDHGISSSYQFH